MINRSVSKMVVVVFLALLSQLSLGAGKQPFTQALFEQLQQDNKVVLVDIFADWCSTCAKQEKVIQSYIKKHPDRELHILQVDFDNQKEIVKQFRAPRQSTMLLYKGDEQFWYAVAETREDVITAELEKAFNFTTKK